MRRVTPEDLRHGVHTAAYHCVLQNSRRQFTSPSLVTKREN